MTDITDHSVDLTPVDPDPAGRGRLARLRDRFALWRRTRPFWGCVILALGAWFIARPLLGGALEFYTTVGVRSMTPLLIASGMLAAAGVALLVPAQRHFPAIVAMLLSVASLPLANLGGWLVGMVLGILGSGLVFAWTPYSEKQLARFAERDERRVARRAARRAAR